MVMPPTKPKSSADTAVIGPASGNGMTEFTNTFSTLYSMMTVGEAGSKVIPRTVRSFAASVEFSASSVTFASGEVFGPGLVASTEPEDM